MNTLKIIFFTLLAITSSICNCMELDDNLKLNKALVKACEEICETHEPHNVFNVGDITQLLEAKASVNYKNGRSLFIALENDHIHIAQLLVKHKAHVNQKNSKGETPLCLAAKRCNIINAFTLFAAGTIKSVVDSNLPEYNKLSLLYYAEQWKKNTLQLLLNHGAEVNKKDKRGRSPLYWAVENNSLEAMQLLVGYGAKINELNENGRYPLHCMIKSNNIEAMQLLADHGANVNQPDQYGRSPLRRAIKNKNDEAIYLLVNHGAIVTDEIIKTTKNKKSKDMLQQVHVNKPNIIKLTPLLRLFI